MGNKMIFSDNNLMVWDSATDGDITMYLVDRGIALKFDFQEWDSFLTKMVVIAYNQGIGLMQGFNKLYGTVN